ncbi:MAG TPA: class I SAM-dependent methyltransferase [Steroidobacteraceae bacterium]|nr:class I SAM-dependent methyltransferase [Steroidobacteraceae bacterium]
MSAQARTRLLAEASEPYRAAGRFAYHFARGKLGGDPAFTAILERGLLAGHSGILDLGCGQGLLAAWLRAAARCWAEGCWPAGWPPPPSGVSWRGIELMPRDIERARLALGPAAALTLGDIRSVGFGTADAVVVLDVLHYMSFEEQRAMLQRVRAALRVPGRLLLRVGDRAGGLRFHISRWVDHAALLARGHGLAPLHCRGIAQWRALLRECGFDSEPLPMSQGTPFANVMLIAHPT